MLDAAQINPEQLKALSEAELRELGATLLSRLTQATLKLEKLSAQQRTLFDDAIDADIAALEAELEDLKGGLQFRTRRSCDPSAHRCRRNCRAWITTTSPTARCAPVDAHPSAWART